MTTMFRNPFKRREYEPLPCEDVFDYSMTKDSEKPCKYTSVHHGFSIQDLPFKPSHNEVIYVENDYDGPTNRFIVDNIGLLRECFAKHNLVFVYLPLLGRDLADEKVWRYRKPYGPTESAGELPPLRSDFLLGHMKSPENRDKMTPCFARYNYSVIDFDAYTKEHAERWDNIFDTFTFDVGQATDVRDYVENICDYVSGKLFWWSGCCCLRKQTFGDADDAFECDTEKLLANVRYEIELLRRKGISEVILRQLVEPEVKLSRIVIRKDYTILLPDYGNMEIAMTPLVKAVYLLFLRHPEGIVFKHLPDYRRELADIYDAIKSTTDSSRTFLGIRRYCDNIINVTDPLNNSINEKCARIKEAFLTRFHESMSCHYYITGKRGEPKRILLPPELIVWEV